MSVTRRRFLESVSALGAAALVGSPRTNAASRLDTPFTISLAQWSCHKMLFAKQLDPLDFPKFSKEKCDIDAIELVNQFYMEKVKDDEYMKQLKKRCDDHGVSALLIMCDREGALGDADEAKRKQAVENHHKWVDAAKLLGCHSIRVNAQSSGSYDDQMKQAADGLSKLSEYGAKHDISVIVENHGGLSSNGAWLAGVMKLVGNKRCGTLPDFGNFRISKDEEYDRYKGVAELMPFAKGVSAKSHDFNEAGEEIHTDYRKMMKIVLDAGYHGRVGVEYEGSKIGELEGILATKKLLEKIRSESHTKAP